MSTSQGAAASSPATAMQNDDEWGWIMEDLASPVKRSPRTLLNNYVKSPLKSPLAKVQKPSASPRKRAAVNADRTANVPLPPRHILQQSKQAVPQSSSVLTNDERVTYADNMRKLIITARKQINDLQLEIDNLKQRLEASGIVECPACCFRFKDRLHKQLPKYMKVYRGKLTIELEFHDLEKLSEWLHLNALDTNSDGLPTLVRQQPERLDLNNTGSLLPELVKEAGLAPPRQRVRISLGTSNVPNPKEAVTPKAMPNKPSCAMPLPDRRNPPSKPKPTDEFASGSKPTNERKETLSNPTPVSRVAQPPPPCAEKPKRKEAVVPSTQPPSVSQETNKALTPKSDLEVVESGQRMSPQPAATEFPSARKSAVREREPTQQEEPSSSVRMDRVSIPLPIAGRSDVEPAAPIPVSAEVPPPMEPVTSKKDKERKREDGRRGEEKKEDEKRKEEEKKEDGQRKDEKKEDGRRKEEKSRVEEKRKETVTDADRRSLENKKDLETVDRRERTKNRVEQDKKTPQSDSVARTSRLDSRDRASTSKAAESGSRPQVVPRRDERQREKAHAVPKSQNHGNPEQPEVSTSTHRSRSPRSDHGPSRSARREPHSNDRERGRESRGSCVDRLSARRTGSRKAASPPRRDARVVASTYASRARSGQDPRTKVESSRRSPVIARKRTPVKRRPSPVVVDSYAGGCKRPRLSPEPPRRPLSSTKAAPSTRDLKMPRLSPSIRVKQRPASKERQPSPPPIRLTGPKDQNRQPPHVVSPAPPAIAVDMEVPPVEKGSEDASSRLTFPFTPILPPKVVSEKEAGEITSDEEELDEGDRLTVSSTSRLIIDESARSDVTFLSSPRFLSPKWPDDQTPFRTPATEFSPRMINSPRIATEQVALIKTVSPAREASKPDDSKSNEVTISRDEAVNKPLSCPETAPAPSFAPERGESAVMNKKSIKGTETSKKRDTASCAVPDEVLAAPRDKSPTSPIVINSTPKPVPAVTKKKTTRGKKSDKKSTELTEPAQDLNNSDVAATCQEPIERKRRPRRSAAVKVTYCEQPETEDIVPEAATKTEEKSASRSRKSTATRVKSTRKDGKKTKLTALDIRENENIWRKAAAVAEAVNKMVAGDVTNSDDVTTVDDVTVENELDLMFGPLEEFVADEVIERQVAGPSSRHEDDRPKVASTVAELKSADGCRKPRHSKEFNGPTASGITVRSEPCSLSVSREMEALTATPHAPHRTPTKAAPKWTDDRWRDILGTPLSEDDEDYDADSALAPAVNKASSLPQHVSETSILPARTQKTDIGLPREQAVSNPAPSKDIETPAVCQAPEQTEDNSTILRSNSCPKEGLSHENKNGPEVDSVEDQNDVTNSQNDVIEDSEDDVTDDSEDEVTVDECSGSSRSPSVDKEDNYESDDDDDCDFGEVVSNDDDVLSDSFEQDPESDID